MRSSPRPAGLGVLHDAELSGDEPGPACADAEPLAAPRLLGTAATGALCVALGVGLSALGTGRIADALTGDPRTALMLVARCGLDRGRFVQKPLELRGQTPAHLWAWRCRCCSFLPRALARAFVRPVACDVQVAGGRVFVLLVQVASRRMKAVP